MMVNAAVALRQLDLKKQENDPFSITINKSLTKVYVVCTGGTLTMVQTDHGMVSKKGLIERLKKFNNLYDKEYSEE